MKVYKVALIALLIMSLAGCKQKDESDTLVILTSSGYEPYEMIDTKGNLTGFDIELMEALALELGITIIWKDVDFGGIIGSLQSGQYEVAIAGITPTDERKESIDFSNVYYNSEAGLQNYMVYLNEDTITTLDDLDGLVIGVQLGTIQEELANSLSKEYNFTVETRNSNAQIVEEIKANIIDVLFVESLISNSILESNEVLVKAILDSDLADITGNAIAFSKDSLQVVLFNEALVTLQENGTIDALVNTWFTKNE